MSARTLFFAVRIARPASRIAGVSVIPTKGKEAPVVEGTAQNGTKSAFVVRRPHASCLPAAALPAEVKPQSQRRRTDHGRPRIGERRGSV